MRGALTQALVRRIGGRQHRLLLHGDDAEAIAQLQPPIIEQGAAGHYPQQRRFAGAVAADEADAIALIERAGRLVQERREPVGELRVDQRQQGHGSLCRSTDR